jgi:Arylsulfotransferase (ASST)
MKLIAAGLVWCSLTTGLVADDADRGAGAAATPRGLIANDPAAAGGYTLIAPLGSYRTVLLDMEGKIVREWKSAYAPGAAVYLLANGNLLRCRRDIDTDFFEGGGIGGGIEEIAPNGDIVWEYTIKDDKVHSHHDVCVLPNGNVLAILWERKSGTKAAAAGREKSRLEAGEFWPDAVIEIEKQPPSGGRIVWEWHAFDHLIQDHDPNQQNYGDVAAHPELIDVNGERRDPPKPKDEAAKDADALRQAGYLAGNAKDAKGRPRNLTGADWLHSNAIAYNEALDQIVLSVHHFDEMWVIDHSTTTEEAKGHTGGRSGKGGDLLYRFGNPRTYRAGTPDDRFFFGQHNVHWIEPGLPGAGNFLVYNNGSGRPEPAFSTIEEFAAPIDANGHYLRESGKPFGPKEMVWRYGGTPQSQFYSSFISGVQRLRNGNTLICVGAEGRVFEVTRDGRVVWDFWNDVGGDAPMSLGKHLGPAKMPGGKDFNPYALFRATRLAPDHPGIVALGLPSK